MAQATRNDLVAKISGKCNFLNRMKLQISANLHFYLKLISRHHY